MSYFSWWYKNRFLGTGMIPRFWNLFWWKNSFWYGIRRFFFFIVNQYPIWAQWEIPSYLSTIFLKATAWMLPDGTSGFPGLERMLEDGIPESSPYIKERDDARMEKAVAKWKEIIHKIRFAHFYMEFIQDDQFGWMIHNSKDREYCRRWAIKKYPHVKEFLTEEFFNTMYTDESLRYESNMNFVPLSDGPGGSRIEFTDTLKETGEVIKDLPIETSYPHLKITKDMEPQFNEGMDLFRKWYQALWD
jgi:hypothetical protein